MRLSPYQRFWLGLALLGGGAAALLWLGLEASTRPPAPETPPALRPAAAAGTANGPRGPKSANEAARLRAEIDRLREQLGAEEKNRAALREELADALHELAELRRPMEIDMASATLRAELSPGEGVVTGGYRLPDGSRLFAFVETDERPDGGIDVVGRFYAVGDGAAPEVGVQNLLTEAANTLQHGEVWMREEIAAVTTRLQQSGAARGLGLGATALRPGNASVVSIGGNPPLSYRVYIDRAAGGGLDFDLRLESIPDAPAAAPPASSPASAAPTATPAAAGPSRAEVPAGAARR